MYTDNVAKPVVFIFQHAARCFADRDTGRTEEAISLAAIMHTKTTRSQHAQAQSACTCKPSQTVFTFVTQQIPQHQR
jgi:hypothetical protein